MQDASPPNNEGRREGSLDAPTRHPIPWQEPGFYEKNQLNQELERVFNVCHGCRRCVSLCNAFPSLFDLVDDSPTLEIDGVDKSDYPKVVEHCYLCDLCFMTKCPYVPPHPWNIDFPHLMLRAKAVYFREGGATKRDKLLAGTDELGQIAGIPVVAQTVNAVMNSPTARKLVEKTVGLHAEAWTPDYQSKPLHKRLARRGGAEITAEPTEQTRGKLALFATCYGERNEPQLAEDLIQVFEFNGISVRLTPQEVCCAMPKLELGDLDAVARHKEQNIPMLARLVDEGYDLVAPVPSCVLMFKQELPLLFPQDADVKKVAEAFFDPFEYLMLRHKAGKLNTAFKNPLGKVAYHAACHQRVQNIGPKTREFLQLIPGTTVETIERCSGHNGTYALKKEFYPIARKIGQPVVSRIEKSQADHYVSDCALAGHHLEGGMEDPKPPTSPFALIRLAYGI